MRRRVLAALIAAALATAVWTSQAGAETIPTGGNIAMSATGKAAGATGYYDLQAKPGEAQTLTFMVRNPSGKPVEATVYASDSATADGGGIRARLPEDPNAATGLWLSPQSYSLKLAPGEQRPVTFTLQVPGDAQPGQHVAAVIARVLNEGADPGQAGKDQANFKVNIANTVVIGVLATVPGPITPKLTVTGVDHFFQGDQFWAAVTVRNEGNQILKPEGQLRLQTPDGRPLGPRIFALGSVYPGTEARALIPIEEGVDREGKYQATVDVTYGGPRPESKLHASQNTVIELSEASVATADSVRYAKIKELRTDDVLVLSKGQILMYGAGGLLLLLLLVALLFLLLRRRQPARSPKPAGQEAAGADPGAPHGRRRQ
jgi:hypothetical protein